MNRAEAWKNFDLGQELTISGAFIFNGLRTFHDMETLEDTDEVFEFLYNLAVGLERLLKVVVILIEHDSGEDQKAFEVSLLTHNHLELLQRIRTTREVTLGPPHHRLLGLLSTFYKTFRYDRFVLSVGWKPDKEQAALKEFLEKSLQIKIAKTDPFAIENTPRFRRHLGKVVCTIAKSLFRLVRERARELNLYTYELRHGSKAEWVFLGNGCNFEDDDVLWKELLIFLINTKETSGALEYIREIDPLSFDKALVPDYLQCFRYTRTRPFVMGELEELYTELSDVGDRLARLSPLGEAGFMFPDDDIDPSDIDSPE